MATIEVSTADELITALEETKTETTTIQLTTDIDMNNNILEKYITIYSSYITTITGKHDNNERYSIKNLQSTGDDGFLYASSTTNIIFEYINFINVYSLTARWFARGCTFNFCNFFGTLKPSSGFYLTSGASRDPNSVCNYCNITFDNSILANLSLINTECNYCYLQFNNCVNIGTSSYYTQPITNCFFNGNIVQTETAYITNCRLNYCILNLSITSTYTTINYSLSAPSYISLQNTTNATGITLSTSDTLISLTDEQLKDFDSVYNTGFPIVKYTE